MKVATILPQSYLSITADDDYLMALAHLIDKKGMEVYTEFFRSKGQDEKTFIILDNGVIEGNPRPIGELLKKAQYIQANEIVLPDVFREATKTLHAIEEATNYLALHYKEISNLSFMAVPQGQTLDEWVSCAAILLRNPVVTCIGIPKVLVDIVGRDGRLKAIQLLADMDNLEGRDIHLLGCWTTPLEITTIAKQVELENIPFVRGVDSAIAYVMARSGIKLNCDDRPDQSSIDFENGKIDDEILLKYNVGLWRDAVDMNTNKKVLYI